MSGLFMKITSKVEVFILFTCINFITNQKENRADCFTGLYQNCHFLVSTDVFNWPKI